MEWFGGSSVKEIKFQIEDELFIFPASLLNQTEVYESGLGLIARREGYKDVPPVLPRNDEGAFLLTRPKNAFRLMLSHLKGEDPLLKVPLRDFGNAYIMLKTELTFWQLPTNNVKINDLIYYDSAWTDRSCFYPLKKEDAKVFERVGMDQPEVPRVHMMKKETSIPDVFKDLLSEEELKDWSIWHCDTTPTQQGAIAASKPQYNHVYVAAGKERFYCKFGSMDKACVLFESLPINEKLSPMLINVSERENTLVWDRGNFVYMCIKSADKKTEVSVIRRKPSWLCVHPIVGLVLSGCEGPIPHVYCFDMNEADVVRFFPWGTLVLIKEITLQTGKPKKDELKDESEELVRRSSKSYLTTIGTTFEGIMTGKKVTNEDRIPPRPGVVACIMRVKNKQLRPPEHIALVNFDRETVGQINLKHGIDFDIIDLRDNEELDYDVVVSINGGLASRKSSEFQEDKVGGKVGMFAVNMDKQLMKQPGLLISNGGPHGEMLHTMTLFGEYDVKSEKYYNFSLAKSLLDFHKNLQLLRQPDSSGCTIQ